MPNSYFQFKQFKVKQDNAAMKVGTDGVLLGVWADVFKVKRALDIGTGTGLIALMLAQRNSNVVVDGLEIDESASMQAQDNFTESKWNNRLRVVNQSLQSYRTNENIKYDLIVSNPPFFNNSLKNSCKQKSMARHTDSLPYSELLAGVKRLLSDDGKFSVVLPADSKNIFVKTAMEKGLYLSRNMSVYPTPTKDVKRVLMEFVFKENEVEIEKLIVEEFGRHGYSEDYKKLTKDFYLAF